MGKRLDKIFKTIEECPPRYVGDKPNNFKDITNKQYNFLKVLYLVGFKNNRAEWLCQCTNCGNYVIVNSHNLRSGHTKSCGCLISEKLRKDKVGKQYGLLKVIKYDCSKNEMPYYIVECQNCKKVYSISGHALDTQYSCGCLSMSNNAHIIYQTLKNSSLYHLQNVQTEKTFDDCVFKQKLKFDFYIPKYEYQNKLYKNTPFLMEYDGEQHFMPIKFNNNKTDTQMYKDFISQQTKDWYKDYYCITHNIPLLRIDYIDKKNCTVEQIMQNSHIINDCSSDIIDVFDINTCDFVNNKNVTFIIYSGISCTFKCCKDNPQICQNSALSKSPKIRSSIKSIIQQYNKQDIAKNITFQGLEVLDNIKQLLWFIYYFRQTNNDDIYIWTGYTEEECEDFIYLIKNIMKFPNIIIKFGRYIPNQQAHYDDTLGVNLASNNQYAIKIS